MGVYLDKAIELRPIIEKAVVNGLDDADAANAVSLFPNFSPEGKTYSVGDRFRYNDELYRVLQEHVSNGEWTPDNAPSLYAKVLTDPEGKPLVWVQPDSTNAYMTGDRVLYPDENGDVYESTIDNNVWSPAEYPQGWQKIV